MTLVDQMKLQGSWLFRWRSLLPMALLAILLPPSLVGLHWPLGSYEFHEIWEFLCAAVSFVGLAVRCATVGFAPVGTSGRGTTRQRALVLNTTGMYSIVRHPLYLGNYLVGLGVTLVWFDWWAPMIYSLCFWIYYERIMIAEEQFLSARFGKIFRRWANKTPAFLPSAKLFASWKRPDLEFSLLSTVRREYSTLVLIVALHAGMEVIENYWLAGRITFGLVWGCVLAASVAFYAVLKVVKRRTRLLTIAGR